MSVHAGTTNFSNGAIKNSARSRCTHCALPVPAGLVAPDSDEQFCCNACKIAYKTIHSCNLDKYYELSRALAGPKAAPAAGTGDPYEHFGDPVFHDLYVTKLSETQCAVELVIDGMHCGACVWLLERLPKVCSGVVESRVRFGQSRLRLTWNSEQVSLPEIARAVDGLGYRLRAIAGQSADESAKRERQRTIVRLGVAGALAGNVMLASVALYAGEASGMASQHHQLFRWVSLILSLVAIAWPGATFFRGAIAAVRTGVPHTDVPVSLGLAVGAIAGIHSAITGGDVLYADTLVMLVFLLLIGRWFQSAQQRWSTESIELFHSIAPSTARRLQEDGEISTVPTEALQPGDLIEVLAGETCPADGLIEYGSTTLDRALMTGESLPVDAGIGKTVEAGVINLSSPIRLRITTTGAATRIGKLVEQVQLASESRAPFVRLADATAKRFVVIIIAVAMATAIGWWFVDPSRVFSVVASLLIVTCPCALALSTPLTVSVAIGKALRRGICIKGGETLEAIARAKTIVLDKTGTLTKGDCTLVRWIGDQSVQTIVAAVEAGSAHPVARALVEQLPSADESVVVTKTHSTLGGGVHATANGRDVAIGSEPFARRTHPELVIESWARDAIESAAAEGLSPVVVAIDSTVVAVALVGDTLREGAPAFVGALRRAGKRVIVLSGDRQDVTDAIAAEVGIDRGDAIGSATPEEKADIIADLMSISPMVAMVGDGVNDAAAMARSSVGIAVHGGAEAAMSAADVYLSRPGLDPLNELFSGATRTSKLLVSGVVVSLIYNATFAALAIAGLMSPLLAAILMPISSVAVTVLARYGKSF